jgi:hypothetical protein
MHDHCGQKKCDPGGRVKTKITRLLDPLGVCKLDNLDANDPSNHHENHGQSIVYREKYEA